MARKIYEDEIRSRRISLAVTPKLYDSVNAMALIRRQSVNDFVIELLNRMASKNADVIEKFQAEKDFVDVDD